MFKHQVSETPVTRAQCEWYFRNERKIYIEGWQGDGYLFGCTMGDDRTFGSTLFGLLYEKENIALNFRAMRVDWEDLGTSWFYRDNVIEALLEHNKVTICYLKNTSGGLAASGEVKNAMQELKDKLIASEDYDFTYQEGITAFFGDAFKVYVILNYANHSSFVLMDSISIEKWHWIQAVLPMIMPWHFQDPETLKISLTDEQKAILEALNRTDGKGAYLTILQEIYDKLDLDTKYTVVQIGNVVKNHNASAQERVKRSIREADETIENFSARITELINQRRDLENRLFGLLNNPSSLAADELIDYFTSNKGLAITDSYNNTFAYDVKGYMSFFDEEPIETLLGNEHSVLYDGVNQHFTRKDMKLLIKGIFIDQVLRMRTSAHFSFRLSDNEIRADGTGVRTNHTYLPNPHIYHYNCITGFRGAISQALSKNDFVGAIHQTVISTQQMNFYDSAVMARFSSDITSHLGYKCYEDSEGNLLDARQAVEYLKGYYSENVQTTESE